MLQHSGLDDAQLGPRLARLLAPGSPLPAREMVARGLAPLAGAEPFLALYHLWVVGGATLAEQASRTAAELPAPAVVSALVDPHLPAPVLDFMARRRLRSPDTLRLLVHHPRVCDQTLQTLARAAPTPVCDALAHNQRRWLACPAIALQLIRNPHCDRATAHAVLELGAREGVAALAAARREALAGAVLQDSLEHSARLAAWLLRGAATDPLPDLPAPPDALLPASLGGAPDPRQDDLTQRPAATPRPADLPASLGGAPAPRQDDLPQRPAATPRQADLPQRPAATPRQPSSPAPPILGAPPTLSVRPPNLSPGPVPKPPPVPTTKQPGKPAARPSKPAAWAADLSARPAASVRPDLSSEPAPARPDLSPGPARATATPPSTRPDLSARPAAPTRSPPPAHADLFSGKTSSTQTTGSASPARPDLSSGPAAPASPARPDLSSGPAAPARSPGSATPVRTDLSSRPAAPSPPPPAANTRPARSLDLTPPAQLDDDLDSDNDELDLPIAEGWDEALGPGIADIPPPAPRSSVPWPETDVPLPPPPPRKPEQRSLFSDALDGVAAPAPLHAPTPAPPAPTYADRVARVFDRRTPLTLAMSLLHQLRPADLRRVATARHLADALVIAARRRVRPEARPR